MLAAELDPATAGYGAYWVGRAILIAERCLAERGQSLNVNYLRGMLRRWQREGSWGSDLEGEGERLPPPPRPLPAPAQPVPLPAPAAVDRPTTDAAGAEPMAVGHPALAAYSAAFGRAPNAVQAQQIAEVVTDMALWQRVLTDWQANGWKEGAVAKMLDRYRKEAGLVSSNEPERPPRSSSIHDYPGLTSDERSDWLLRFHRAETPDAKRAVLARLAQEHPREGMKAEG
jgi:hypothetical protein